MTISLETRQEKLVLIETVYRGSVSGLEDKSPRGQVARLRFALLNNHRDAALEMLSKYPDLSFEKDSEGAELIHDACLGGIHDAVKRMLDLGCDPNQTSELGRTPLCEAVYRWHEDIVRLLLDAGAMAHVEPKIGEPPIIEAGNRGRPRIMSMLLDQGAPFHLRSQRKGGYSLLHYAAELGDAELADKLLKKGIHPDIETEYRLRPLIVAAMHGKRDVIQLLIDRGVELNAKDPYGETALQRAAAMDTTCLRTLVQAGADVRVENRNGISPLGFAAGAGDLETVQLILEKGVPVDPVSDNGISALCLAASSGKKEVIKWLLENTHADINYQSKERGTTPLLFAACEKDASTLVMLFEHGAKLESTDVYGNRALHISAAHCLKENVQTLLRLGAEKEAKDLSGRTPLIHACSNCYHWKRDEECLETMQALMDAKVEVNAQDKNGWTPLHHAANDAHPKSVKLLLERGARVEIRDALKRRALDHAIDHRVADPYEDRRSIIPASKTEDPYYEVIQILVEEERRIGLHPFRLRALRKRAAKKRCPEVLDLLA